MPTWGLEDADCPAEAPGAARCPAGSRSKSARSMNSPCWICSTNFGGLGGLPGPTSKERWCGRERLPAGTADEPRGVWLGMDVDVSDGTKGVYGSTLVQAVGAGVNAM